MKIYKVLLNKEGKLISPYQKFEFAPGKKYVCADFDASKKECSRGFYATDIEGLVCVFRNTPEYEIREYEIWECEVGGKSVELDIFKRRYEEFELIRKIEKEEVVSLAKAKEPDLGWKLSEALYPINPFIDRQCLRVSDSDIDLLKKWASVWTSVWDSTRYSGRESVWDSIWDSIWGSIRASVWASVWASVGASVGNSVEDLVEDSVGDLVEDSVGDSVGAYISSLFPNIKKWKYVEHEEGVNSFQCGIDLWNKGLVPSYDGSVWRLHGYEGKILWEGKL